MHRKFRKNKTGGCVALVQLARGITLMGIGLASKAFFLFVIAPGLQTGEFAKYFLAVSVAVIVGRLLSLGAHEEVVFRVRHSLIRIGYYLRAAVLYYLLAWSFFLWTYFLGDADKILPLAVAYALMISGNGFVTGAMRSRSNLFQEFNAHSPWFFICILSLFTPVQTARDVFCLLIISHSIIYFINMMAAFLLGVRHIRPSLKVLLGQLSRYRRWLPMSLSSIGLAANLRSYPLWLGGLGFVVSDGLAYAFSIGEVIYQLCMVYVHQVHSSQKLQEKLARPFSLLRPGIAMVILAALLPFPTYLLTQAGITGSVIDLTFMTLICASIYCGSLAVFSLLRISVWRFEQRSGALRILGLQLLLFLVVGLLVWLMEYNVLLLLLAAMINVTMMSFYISRYRNGTVR